MRETEPLPEILRRLLVDQSLAVLASTGVHTPYASLIAFSISDDLRRLYFATHRATRKAANLGMQQEVALLVDDRKNRPADFVEAAGVTIRGTAACLEGEGRSTASNGYLTKFPHLKEFLASPDCALYEVRIRQYLLVTRFQQVTEYWLEPDG